MLNRIYITSVYLLHLQDNSTMSGFKETGLPKRLLQAGNDGLDLSERVPPPRSSSPVIGSPPVRVVPIGTPPKQTVSHTMKSSGEENTTVHTIVQCVCAFFFFFLIVCPYF